MDLERGFSANAKGAKIWSKPFYREDENLYLFFVDVQGFDRDEKFSNFIWMLSFLVGTIILYNSKEDISEQTFKRLQPLNYILTALKLSPDDIENNYMMSYYAPKLIWVLKDYRKVENREGKALQPDQYLESCLSEPISDPQIIAIKKFLTNVIKERTCVAFNPLTNVDELFMYTTSVLKERIYSRSFSKYFDGVQFNSRMLVNFIAGFIELYNADKYIEYYDM